MVGAYLAFAFLCLVFGTTFGAIEVGIADGWPPLLAAGTRFASAGALVLAFAGTRHQLRPFTRGDIAPILWIGLTVTTGTFGALYEAERVLPSGLAALLSATSPVFAVILAIADKQRPLDRSVVIGIVLGTIGVACVAGVGLRTDAATLGATVAIIVSEFGYAWGLSRVRAARRSIPMLQLAGAQQLVGGCTLLVMSLIFEHRAPTHAGIAGLASLAYLVLVASAGAHTVSIWLAGRTDATFATSWTYVSPFVALLVGAIVLHEPLGALAWLGGVLVVLGALTLNRRTAARAA